LLEGCGQELGEIWRRRRRRRRKREVTSRWCVMD